MDIFTSSTILLLTWALTLFGAYKAYQKDNHNLSLVFLILGGAILRIWTASDPFLHYWDERYHMLVAKNLSKDFLFPTLYDIPYLEYDFKNWTQNHIWVHKPPMTLWLMALSFKVFGFSEYAGRLPSIVMSIASIYLVYKIAFYLFKDEKIALITAFFQSVNGLIIELAAGRVPTDHVDTTFFFFFALSVFFTLRFYRKDGIWNLIGIGVSFGFALLTKWLVAGTILPMLFVLFYKKESFRKLLGYLTLVTIIGFAMALPWQYYIHTYFPIEAAWESKYNWMHFTENIEDQGKPWWWLFNHGRINWGELIYVAWIWFFYEIYKKPTPEMAFVLTWFLVPYIVFSIAISIMQGYVLFTGPAHFLMMAMFIVFLQKERFKHWFFKVLIFAFFVLAVRYTFERVKPFKEDVEKIEYTKNIKKISNSLPPKSVIFNTLLAAEVRFFTDFPAYEKPPKESDINLFKEKGFEIYIVKRKNLSESILQNENLKFLSADFGDN